MDSVISMSANFNTEAQKDVELSNEKQREWRGNTHHREQSLAAQRLCMHFSRTLISRSLAFFLPIANFLLCLLYNC